MPTTYSKKYPKGVHEFGNQNEESSPWDRANRLIGIKASCPKVGQAQSISVYISDLLEGGKCKCALYRVSDGQLIGYTEEWASEGTEVTEWVTLDIIWGGKLEVTDYYIVYWEKYVDPAAIRYYFGPGKPGYFENGGISYNGFPDVFSPDEGADYHFSFYCTYQPYKNKYSKQSTEYSNKY